MVSSTDNNNRISESGEQDQTARKYIITNSTIMFKLTITTPYFTTVVAFAASARQRSDCTKLAV